MRSKYIAASALLLAVCAASGQAQEPFNYLKVGADAQGFITLSEGGGPYERFFPLGTFFYPAIPGVTDYKDTQADYLNFANVMGGNLVVAPWDLDEWPYRPGAIFQDGDTCGEHLAAAAGAGVKILADPALFWGDTGRWEDDGDTLSSNQREQLFDDMVEWVEDSEHAGAFMGYYHWDRPAWRYYDSRNRLPEPRPSYGYTNSATNQLRTLENGENASHAIFMAQDNAVKVRDLWKDYHNGADIVGSVVLPYPDPSTLFMANEDVWSAKAGCLLPNYYASVTGSLADAVHQTSGYMAPGSSRSKPYLAVLQAKNQGGVGLTFDEMRFQAYDAIIHGAKGLVWYDDNDYQTRTQTNFFYTDGNIPWHLRDLMNELSGLEVNGVIKGDYDTTVVAVTAKIPPNYITAEQSTFISGKLVPKTHYLSDRVVMEGVAKRYGLWTYLIVACRPSESAAAEYKVRFRPFFSAYDSKNPWGQVAPNNTVEKLFDGYMTVIGGEGGGYWEDTFHPGDVFIYKFETPAPWQPPGGVPE
jgi:hypothetical protein